MSWQILESADWQECYQNEDLLRGLLANDIEYSTPKASERIIDMEVCVYSDAPGEAEAYFAIERIENNTKTIKVVVCVLSNEVAQRAMENKTQAFAWKEIPEGDGPAMSNCPPRILDQLTPTDDPHTLAWRIRCREEYMAHLGTLLITAEMEPHSIELEDGETLKGFTDNIKADLDEQRQALRSAQNELEKLGGPPFSLHDLMEEQISTGKFVRVSALGIDQNKVHVLFRGLGPEGKVIIIGRYMSPETYDQFPLNQVTTLEMYESTGPLLEAPDTYPNVPPQ